MRTRKFLVIFTAVVFAVSGASSFSCIQTADKITFHCVGEDRCNRDLGSNEMTTNIAEGSIPESGNQTLIENNSYNSYSIRSVDNRDLPSVSNALSADKSVCPAPSDTHVYPKSSFDRSSLEDLTGCYKTVIEDAESYYVVEREGTTEPLTCVKKTEHLAVTGASSYSYIEKIGPKWILLRISTGSTVLIGLYILYRLGLKSRGFIESTYGWDSHGKQE